MKLTASQEPAEQPNSSADARRFVLNVGSNLLMLVLNVITGLWLTSYLVSSLGVGLYGIVALATSVTLYMSVISTSLSNGVGRYLAIEIKQGRSAEANRTFNTALLGSLGLCAITLPGVALMAFFAPQIFSVPPGYEQAARWLFGAVMLAYLISVVRGIFTVSTFVHSRFDLQNLVLATNLIARLLLIVALFAIAAPGLVSVGIATLVATLASLLVAMQIWRRLTPELAIAPETFDRSHLRTLSGTSGWFFVNQVGTLLFLNIDLLVVNIFLGPETAGRYGVVLQWPLLLRTLAITVSSVLTPLILTQYAGNDMTAITRTTRQAVKLMGLALALPVGFIVGLAGTILTIWLGAEFADLAPLLIILVAPLIFNIAIQPLFSTQVALNRVRWPGIASLVMGLLNIVFAIWWVNWLPDGMGVALAGGLLLTLKNVGFVSIYNASIQELPWYTFLTAVLPGIIGMFGVALVSMLAGTLLPIGSWFTLGGVGVIIGLFYAAVVYRLALNAADRSLFLRLIRRQRA